MSNIHDAVPSAARVGHLEAELKKLKADNARLVEIAKDLITQHCMYRNDRFFSGFSGANEYAFEVLIEMGIMAGDTIGARFV